MAAQDLTRIHIVTQTNEKERWLAAAGDVPLSRWIRRVCNEACYRGGFEGTETERDPVRGLAGDAGLEPRAPAKPEGSRTSTRSASVPVFSGPDPKPGRKQ